MRIWKKISAGFGVLLVLVLLVGVVALHALYSIEQETTAIMKEMPTISEKSLDLRRDLLRGIKDYNSFFLTARQDFWIAGENQLQNARQILENLLTANTDAVLQRHVQPLAEKLTHDITVYQQQAASNRDMSALNLRSKQAMLGHGNKATALALSYLDSQIRQLNALPDQPASEEFQRLRQRLTLADALNQSVADTRRIASQGFAHGRSLDAAQTGQLLEKDMLILRQLLATETQSQDVELLQNLREALTLRSQLSNENAERFAIIQKAVESMGVLESSMFEDSRHLLMEVQDAFLDQLTAQRALSRSTGDTLLLFLLGTFAFGVIFATLLSRHLMGGLMRSLNFARSVSSGDLSQRQTATGNDELGQINQAMNTMLDSLQNKIEETHHKELEAIEARHQAEKAQSAAEDASRTKDDFLARMSHEIRTPMNAVIGLSHLCQQTRLDDQQRQYMNKILNSANELLGILNEILDFSKIEGGKLELDHIPFQLNVVMDNLARIISNRAKEKDLDFVYHMDRNIPAVLVGDPLRLTQVLINLAGNAVKFTEKGTVAISILAEESGPHALSLCFSIKDTGIGMTPEQVQHIFQPFVQADGSITRRFGGTGIGLSISQRLVSLMNGTIEAESVPSGGSVFRFTVPLEVADPTTAMPLRTVQDIRALIVDDSQLSLHVTSANFDSLGIASHCVESGPEAIKALAKAEQDGMPYHLIILDWRMPDMDGLETARRIRQMATSTEPPVIIMHSDYELQEVRPLAQEVGIDAFLPKPATASAFYDAIMNALGHHLDHGVSQQPIPAQQARSDNSRVLLVEDNEINQEIACELLRMAQVRVDTVNNGQEAVDAVAQTAYALIFMDVQMPVMDGLEATRRIRAAGYTMPIIAMTAHAMRGDRDISLSAGMNDHLTKPLDPEALFTTINHWLPFATSSVVAPAPGSPSATQSRDGSTVAPGTTTSSTYTRARRLPDRIEGFNLSAGLSAVGKNEALYADLLGKFASRYATITEDITNSLQNNDLETAVRLAHTVKGIAANLGAESLAEAAGALEKTITNDPSMTAPHLKTLVLRLADAVTAVWDALGTGDTNKTTAPSAPVCTIMNADEMEQLCENLHEAILNMEIDWDRAASVSQKVHKDLQGTSMEAQAQQLCFAVEDFETAAAQELSLALQQALREARDSHG